VKRGLWLLAALALLAAGGCAEYTQVYRPPETVSISTVDALAVVLKSFLNDNSISLMVKDGAYVQATTRGLATFSWQEESDLTYVRMGTEVWRETRLGPFYAGCLQVPTDPSNWTLRVDRLLWERDIGKTVEPLKRFGDAVSVLKRLPEGTPFDAVDAPRLLWLQGKKSEARGLARETLESHPRWALQIGEANLDDFFDVPLRYRNGKAALEKAVRLEGAGDLPGAFRAYEEAWGWSPDIMADGLKARQGMWRLYPRLPSKPELPEEGRRFYLQGEAGADAKNYPGAIRGYGGLVDRCPWYPAGWYNLALVYEAMGPQDEFLTRAAKCMKAYLWLVPDAPEARAAQDMIYRWEGRAKK